MRATEARKLTESATEGFRDLLHRVYDEIEMVAGMGHDTVDCTVDGTHLITDSYRHVEDPLQTRLVARLKHLGFDAEIIRERVVNSQPGPVKDRCFVRIAW